jgi:hypothetical protein
MAVYIPSLTNTAGQLALDMKNSSLLVPYGEQAAKVGLAEQSNEAAAEQPAIKEAEKPRERPRIQRGPTGRVNGKDL